MTACIAKSGWAITKQILAALIKKDARAAKLAMWQHLENVKQRLLEFSNVDDIYFDGYLFDSWPLDKVDASMIDTSARVTFLALS